MEFFKDVFIHSYFGGVFWIAFGLFFLRSWTKKKKEDNVHMDSERLVGNLRGFAAGVGGIALGFIIIIGKILGKL